MALDENQRVYWCVPNEQWTCRVFDRTNIHWPLEAVACPAVDVDSNGLEQVIRELSADHAHFAAILDRDSADVLIGGCDERQLEENLKLLRSKIAYDVKADTPQIGYRETIRKAVEVDHHHRKTTGGTRQYARVKIVVEPLADKFGFEFENKIVGGAVPKKYIASVEKSISVQRSEGPITGFPMVGLKVSFVDGTFYDEDSSEIAFEIAAHAAFRAATENAGLVLLAPIIKVEAIVPEDRTGDLVGDLNNRLGTISGMESVDNTFTITAFVPVTRMFGFANTLSDLTQGQGSFSVQFSHYEEVRSLPGDDPLWPEPAVAALRA